VKKLKMEPSIVKTEPAGSLHRHHRHRRSLGGQSTQSPVYCRADDGKWAGWSATLQAVEAGIVPIDIKGDVGGEDYNAFDYGR
jgi:hypothetical protein